MATWLEMEARIEAADELAAAARAVIDGYDGTYSHSRLEAALAKYEALCTPPR